MRGAYGEGRKCSCGADAALEEKFASSVGSETLWWCEGCWHQVSVLQPDQRLLRHRQVASAVAPEAGGVKDDAGKDPWDLLPWHALEQVVLVLEFGRITYDAENWRGVKGARRRYWAAGLRHLWAWWRGEARDPESGLSHLAHAACCVLFLLDLELGVSRPYRDSDGLPSWPPELMAPDRPRLSPLAVKTAREKKAKRESSAVAPPPRRP